MKLPRNTTDFMLESKVENGQANPQFKPLVRIVAFDSKFPCNFP